MQQKTLVLHLQCLNHIATLHFQSATTYYLLFRRQELSMLDVEVAQVSRVRVPWSLRNKVELVEARFVGQNSLGLPYLQGTLRNRTAHPLELRVVAWVFNEQYQPIFNGRPGILEIFSLEAHKQRAFRISLRDVDGMVQADRQRLWLTRSTVELRIDV